LDEEAFTHPIAKADTTVIPVVTVVA